MDIGSAIALATVCVRLVAAWRGAGAAAPAQEVDQPPQRSGWARLRGCVTPGTVIDVLDFILSLFQ